MSEQLSLFDEHGEPIRPEDPRKAEQFSGWEEPTSLLDSEIIRLISDEGYLEEEALEVSEKYIRFLGIDTKDEESCSSEFGLDDTEIIEVVDKNQLNIFDTLGIENAAAGADIDPDNLSPKIQISFSETKNNGFEIDGYLSELTYSEINKLVHMYHNNKSNMDEGIATIVQPIHTIRFNRSHDIRFNELFDELKSSLPLNIQEYLIKEKNIDNELNKGGSVREDLGNNPQND